MVVKLSAVPLVSSSRVRAQLLRYVCHPPWLCTLRFSIEHSSINDNSPPVRSPIDQPSECNNVVDRSRIGIEYRRSRKTVQWNWEFSPENRTMSLIDAPVKLPSVSVTNGRIFGSATAPGRAIRSQSPQLITRYLSNTPSRWNSVLTSASVRFHQIQASVDGYTTLSEHQAGSPTDHSNTQYCLLFRERFRLSGYTLPCFSPHARS